ncbi:MAG: hypothetical protein ACP5N1_04125 [Candidatus Woesearchaeota archaeon]
MFNHNNPRTNFEDKPKSKLQEILEQLPTAKELKEQTLDLLRTTTIEVYALAALGLGIGLTTSIIRENKRDNMVPLGFSEREQVELDVRRTGQKIGPVNQYYSMTNDMVMKVLECWNDAHKSFLPNETRKFAYYLDLKMDMTYKQYKYELYQYVEWLPKISKEALESLDFKMVEYKLGTAENSFRKTWDDDHDDVYHTEYYTETETTTDSDGNTHTETVTKSREVYDYTTHTYDFFKSYGEIASRQINNLLSEVNDIKLKEKILLASQTNAEGEWAAEKSRELKGKRLQQEELTQIANTWWTGSTLKNNLPIIQDRYKETRIDAKRWMIAKKTAKSDEYTTYSHSDSGPQEFQVVEKTIDDIRTARVYMLEVINGIEYTRENTPILEQKIKEYINIELNFGEGNSTKLKKEIMDITKTIYKENFNKGFGIERFRLGQVFLWSIIGLLGGIATGAGVDYLGKVTNLYGKNEEEERYRNRHIDDYTYNTRTKRF